ncbi:MAG: RluA family pseudouridine synthase [Desulfobacterales bacterium]
MPVTGPFHFVAEPVDAGMRLDLLVVAHISFLTRSQAAGLIQQGRITVNNRPKKPGYRLQAADRIAGCIPEPIDVAAQPEPLDLDILHEDDDMIVLNKSAGMVVHPAPGHASGTLVNALLHHCPGIGPIGGELRPGIVHRLDKDTSGVLIVAKNAAAHAHLAAQFAARGIRKIYLAIVYGEMAENSGVIALPIGRHPVNRKRMSTRSRKPRAAETRWTVRERFKGLTLLELNLKTGRTHQARVHCAAVNHPILGDPVYTGRNAGRGLPAALSALTRSAGRQMLHAWQLTCRHPRRQAPVCFEAPLPQDMNQLIAHLRRLSASGQDSGSPSRYR